MSERLPYRLLIGLGLFTVISTPLVAGEPLSLLLVGERQTRPLALDVRLGDRPLGDAWDTAFANLCRFYDRNGDGRLEPREAARLPSPFALRQILWGQFALDFETGRDAELAADTDGRVAFSTVVDYYRRYQLGNALVAVGRAASTAALNEAMLRHLDADGDSVVSEAELRNAATTLAPLDRNDDELIGPGELNPEVTSYPGTSGTVLALPRSLGGLLQSARQSIVLPPSAPFDEAQPARPLRHMQIVLDSTTASPIESADGDVWSTAATEDVVLHLHRDRGVLLDRSHEMSVTARNWFDKLDANRDEVVSGTEGQGPQQAVFRRCLAVADRNDDGRLSRVEHTAWLGLQSELAEVHVLVSVIDFDRGLFELCDADHDGGLSVRELRELSARLSAAHCLRDGRLAPMRLPHVLLATISRGHPRSLLSDKARRGPVWFQAMDRNGDGDVSRREFLSSAQEFERYDADRDGLLNRHEAASR